MPSMTRARQFVAVMSRRDPAFRHNRTALGAYFARFGRLTRAIRQQIQVDPENPGAWVRPAIIGGVVMVGLVALSVWLLSPNNPESIAGQEPDHYLIDNVAFTPPPAAVRQQIHLGGRSYPKSYILNLGCKAGSLTIGAPLHIEQYRMFTAVFGVPDNAASKSPLEYAVIVDGVTRASGRVSLGQAQRVTVPLDNAREILVRSSSSAVPPSENCDAAALGVGNPGFS